MKVKSKPALTLEPGDIIRHPVGDRLYHKVRWREGREGKVYVATDTCPMLFPLDGHVYVLNEEDLESGQYRFGLQDLTN